MLFESPEPAAIKTAILLHVFNNVRRAGASKTEPSLTAPFGQQLVGIGLLTFQAARARNYFLANLKRNSFHSKKTGF